MTLRNPCRDQVRPDQEERRNPCQEGYVRNEQGVCVPEEEVRTAVTEVPPIPRNPFAVDALLAPPGQNFDFGANEAEEQEEVPDAENAEEVVVPPAMIDYIAATRDLTTIDENNYFMRFPLAIFEEMFKMSNYYIWSQQKNTIQLNQSQMDNFRISMGNFWIFDGESESMYSPVITNPRIPEVQPAVDFMAPLDPYRAIQFQSQIIDPAYNFSYRKLPYNSGKYFSLEILPFKFRKNVIDTELRSANWPQDNTYNAFQDMFLEGSSSPGFAHIGPDFFSQNPLKRLQYSVPNISYNTEYYDFVFDSPAAFLETEADRLIVKPTDVANISVMVQSQEIFQDIEDEMEIPSVYDFYQSKQLEKIIDENEAISEVLPAGQVDFAQRTIRNFDELSNVNEFTSVNIHKFPSDKVEKLEEINEVIRGSLTNFVEISIKTRQGQPINSILQQNKMDLILLEMLENVAVEVDNPVAVRAAAPLQAPAVIRSRLGYRKFTKVLDDEFISADAEQSLQATINDKAVTNITEPVVLYFDEILENVANIAERDFSWPRNLQTYPLYYSGWDREDLLKLEETITSQIFLRKMEQHISTNQLYRHYTDIIHGSKAYAEVLGYKIEKYRVDVNEQGQEIDRKIQQFFLMDSDEIQDINFIDSQVIPDRKYKYKIFTINLVLGSVYQYTSEPNVTRYSWKNRATNELNAQGPAPNPGAFTVGAVTGMVPSIIYAPYFEKTVSLADKPPIFPQVDFLPYQGMDNVHALLLQSNYGEMFVPPVKIFPEDETYVRDMYRRQTIPPGGNILYKSDSLPNGFEIIRIDFEPEAYSDFSDADAIVLQVPATGKTAHVNLDILPNKYYYYCFRTYDDGGLSNPTSVFKVRMVSYQNGIFMEVEEYEMKKKKKEYKLSFEKMLKISPSFDQRVINFSKKLEEIKEREEAEEISELKRIRKELGLRDETSEKDFQRSAPLEEMLSLGTKEGKDSIWNKKYKIRCTSKTTGKKIDINISFVQGKVIIDTPIEKTAKDRNFPNRSTSAPSQVESLVPARPPNRNSNRGPNGGDRGY